MKSLLLLWQRLADELASWCCTSATLDFKKVQARCEHEGLSFLTITLPEFGKDFQKSLDQGQVDRRLFTGFQWKGGLPRFLGGFLDHVFDRDSGALLDNPNVDAILAIRQLTLMFGKISLPCSDARRRDAMSGFVECEKEIRRMAVHENVPEMDRFRRMSSMLFGQVFERVDNQVLAFEPVPKHGPGATADKLLGNQKYNQQSWPQRLEESFPAGDFLLPNQSFLEALDGVDFLEPGSEMPVRVISVPKTLKTPRIIGIEPTAMQYAQQAILPLILNSLNEDDSLKRIIGFTDQTPNQRMAAKGSQYGRLATLDLSEASDRVSNQLVREMLAPWPFLHGAVDASRSRKADVPGHGVLRLSKFASMGSALCFPIEAMIFTIIIFLGIENSKGPNARLCSKDVKHLRNRVRVYGDDIIVPVEYVRSVVQELETFGFRVNLSKSYWNGKFRESCGKEYYDGSDVSIVRVRQMFPTRRMDATGVVSLVSLRNQLYFAGYWQTCRWLDGWIRNLIHHFPTVHPTSPVQGRHTVLGYEIQKECDQLHRPLVKGYVVDAVIPQNPLGDYGALLKYFLTSHHGARSFDQDSLDLKERLDCLPAVDGDHLERSGRPQAVNIKLRWNPPY